MLHAGPTQYESLPSVPQVNAMPQGVPSGPWGPVYRSAPGAQLPAVAYPGMMGPPRAPVRIDGALGQGTAWDTAKTAAVGALFAVITGAAYAFSRDSRRPVLYPALTLGGLSVVGTLAAAMMKNGD